MRLKTSKPWNSVKQTRNRVKESNLTNTEVSDVKKTKKQNQNLLTRP